MRREKIPYRQIHLDFHTSPYIGEIGEDFVREEFAGILTKAHVNSINLFAKCHHGMYYYPTKIGTMHPNLGFDLFGEQVRACREHGIRPIAYTCAAWNEDWADRHPEWLVVDTDGLLGHKKPFDRSFGAWRSLCYNNPEYQELLKEEMKEIYDNYHPDGFWIDIIQGQDCICPHCSRDMKEHGLDPKNIRDVKIFNKISETEFCKEFYSYLKGLDSKLCVYFNSHPYELDNGLNEHYSSREKRQYFDMIDIESLPSDLWGYTHFPIAANYVGKNEEEICMMNGKFHTSWGDFGTIRNQNALEYECFRAIASGAKVCIGDQLHPSGRLDSAVYDRIGKVYERIEAMEPWLTGDEKVCEAAVFITVSAGEVNPDRGGTVEEGIHRILTELHIPYDFVDCKDDLEKYSLLIIPEQTRLGDTGKIESFVKRGGKLLVFADGGLREGEFAVPQIPAKYLGESEFDVRYIEADSEYFPDVPPMKHVLYSPGVRIKAMGEVLAQVTEPYFSRTDEHFCSHRQSPPKCVSTGEAAIVRNDSAVYISAPLSSMYCEYGYSVYKEIVRRCIELLCPRPLIETDLSGISEVYLRKNGEKRILHILSYVITRKAKRLDTIEEKFNECNKYIKFKMERRPEKVTLLAENKEISFQWEDGYVRIPVEIQSGYSAYVID